VPDEPDGLADAIGEGRDVVDEALRSLIGVPVAEPTTAQAHGIAGEPFAEERHQEPPAVLAPDPSMDQDQWRPLSVHVPGDVGAVGGDGPVDPCGGHGLAPAVA
jgi:hypothetical protein